MPISTNEKIDSIVFDLDGTLWDTSEACAASWNNVLARNKISFRQITADDVRRVTGRTHEECIRVTFKGLPEEQLELLVVQTSAEDNLAISQMGGVIYPGVAVGLQQLKRRFPLFIVSNCQSGYIDLFLQQTGLDWVFTDYECWGDTGMEKGENLRDIMTRNNLVWPIMVGDTMGDQKAAAFCGVAFAFVEYGFGRSMAPKRSFKTFDTLVRGLLGA